MVDASVEVIDLRTPFPWDRETVLESVRKTGHLLLVQEPQGSAGVAAVVAEEAMYELQAPIVRVHRVRCSVTAVRHRETRPHRCRPHHGRDRQDPCRVTQSQIVVENATGKPRILQFHDLT